jgi:hypothetical protein
MGDATPAADWSGTSAERPAARQRVASIRIRLDKSLSALQQALVPITFGLLMGSLIALLVLLYSESSQSEASRSNEV